MRKELTLVAFPDGVGIRNYFYSSALDRMNSDIVLFHNFSSETIDYLRSIKEFQGDHSIPDYRETVREKFLRELISLARLRHNARITGNQTLLFNWKRNHKGLLNKIFYKSVEVAALLFQHYKDILRLEQQYQQSLRDNPFYHKVREMLKKINPTMVFCTHQRGLKMAPLFAAATDLGIPTTTVIYSWDNLPKARLALQADFYNVWSDYMKDEMRRFYPEIPSEKIVVNGTPQFDFYADTQYIIPRDDFYSKYHLDSRKIICYSGDDITTSPDDHQYLADVAAAIVAANLQDQFQILFRRCPVDFSDRYDEVLARYPKLIKSAPPLWNIRSDGHWTEAYPDIADVKLLVSTAFYCDLVINLGSTMALDFAMFNKPCLYINYDQPQRANPDWSVDLIYRFEHFKSMEGLKTVGWIDSVKEIVPLVIRASEAPKTVGPDRLKWLHTITGQRPN